MAATTTITEQIFISPSLILVRGTIVFSGNYATGGEVPTYAGIKTSKIVPVLLSISSLAAYQFMYDPATGKLLVFQGDNAAGAAGPGVQLAAAAYPAGLTGVVTSFAGLFKKA